MTAGLRLSRSGPSGARPSTTSLQDTWIVEEKDPNSFITTFPSSEELQQMVLWGPVVAKNVDAIMEI